MRHDLPYGVTVDPRDVGTEREAVALRVDVWDGPKTTESPKGDACTTYQVATEDLLPVLEWRRDHPQLWVEVNVLIRGGDELTMVVGL